MNIPNNITINTHWEKFINDEIQKGKYKSAAEVIESALQLMEKEEQKKTELRDALIQGEDSGIQEDFNPQKHLSHLHKKHLPDH